MQCFTASSLSKNTNDLIQVTPEPERIDLDHSPLMVHSSKSAVKNGCCRCLHDHGLKCKDLKEFDIVFWILVVNTGLIYSTDLSFVNIGSSYLETHYKYSQKYSDSLMTIPFIVAAALTPIMGYISDKMGKRPYFLLLANVMFFAVHYTLSMLPTNESYYALIALSTLGVADSIFDAVIWPSFALVIPERMIGTGYGIPTVCYNAFLALSSMVVGMLSDTGQSEGINYYLNVELYLMALSLLTVIVTVMLLFADKTSGSRLTQPTMKP